MSQKSLHIIAIYLCTYIKVYFLNDVILWLNVLDLLLQISKLRPNKFAGQCKEYSNDTEYSCTVCKTHFTAKFY